MDQTYTVGGCHILACVFEWLGVTRVRDPPCSVAVLAFRAASFLAMLNCLEWLAVPGVLHLVTGWLPSGCSGQADASRSSPRFS